MTTPDLTIIQIIRKTFNKEMIKKFEEYMKKMQKLNVTENY